MAKKAEKQEHTYQVLSHQLDEVLAKLEEPEVAIDEAVGYYEEAMKLIVQLEERLEKAENQVQIIHAKFTGNS